MEILKMVLMFVLATFFAFAGFQHFKIPKFFLKITPPWVPYPKVVNIIVGVAEILLGLGLLIPETRVYAAWGMIALLIAVFPANIYHYTSGGAGTKVSMKFLKWRLPFQFVFLAWAYWYTIA